MCLSAIIHKYENFPAIKCWLLIFVLYDLTRKHDGIDAVDDDEIFLPFA